MDHKKEKMKNIDVKDDVTFTQRSNIIAYLVNTASLSTNRVYKGPYTSGCTQLLPKQN